MAQFGRWGAQPPNRQAFVLYRFTTGALAHVWFSYRSPSRGWVDHAVHYHRFEGDDRPGLYWTVRLSRDDGWDVIDEQPEPYPIDEMNPNRMESYAGQLGDFVAAVLDHRPPEITGADARHTMAMLVVCDDLRYDRHDGPTSVNAAAYGRVGLPRD